MQARSVCLVCSLSLTLATAPVRAQTPGELMDRVGDWVHGFVEQFANVVAEEEYVPRIRSLGPRLRSDYLLVRYPGATGTWLSFRDVVTVDGISLRNQPARLAKLFLEPFDDAVAHANAITKHSARYISPMCDPLIGIAVLQRGYQSRFRYSVGDLDQKVGPGVRRIAFDETARPTIFRDGDRDLPAHGTAWAVEATGRIVRTELHIGVAGRLARTVALTTAFKKDDALQIDVPATMVEGYTLRDSAAVKGTAYYTKFRRFTVRTTEAVIDPKPQ
jgi:hypothetical protein